MALSNSYNYTIDRDTLIKSAYEICHVAVEGESLQTAEITVAARVLNMMLKAWAIHGLKVWKRKTHTITPLVLNKQKYLLGTPVSTAVTLAGSGTTATVTHLQHGFATDDSVIIAGATITEDTNYNGTFTITVTNSNVYTYTAPAALNAPDSGNATLASAGTKIRPEEILGVFLLDSSSEETELSYLSMSEYDHLPNKTTSGTPVQYSYERLLNYGYIYLWPVADSASVADYTINVVYRSPIDDMDAGTDNFDFPSEWLEAITLGLANRLSPRYGVPIQERYLLRKEAQEALDLIIGYDSEGSSVYFQEDVE